MLLRLPALILASVLSLYAALWMFKHVRFNALLLQSGIFAFAVSALFLIGGLAALNGIAQGWRARHSKDAWSEALLGVFLMLGIMLFSYLWPFASRYL